MSQKQAYEFIEKAKCLLQEKPEGVKSSDKSLLTNDKKFCIPNISEQGQMLEWAGVSFGDDNCYLMQKSLKRLACMSGASSLKFFGKIFGTQKDYWIAQGILDFQEEEPKEGQEKRGEGANACVYWACNSLLSDWV